MERKGGEWRDEDGDSWRMRGKRDKGQWNFMGGDNELVIDVFLSKFELRNKMRIWILY